jgi:IS5 family transposase
MQHKSSKTNQLFAEEFRLDKINKQSDPLLKLNQRITWEEFRSMLNEALQKENKGIGGRRPYDYVMMFKILILQRYYNISDDKTEFAILDRLSFMRFLGLTLSDSVPDAKTIWNFREKLIESGIIEKLFELFQAQLKAKGLIANEGKIIDASFVEVPIQRNSKEENEQIKQGETPKRWEENPNKLAQKDTDAKWTKKNDTDYFGYKNHIKADEESKLIDSYAVTDASVHDSQVVEPLLTEQDEGQTLYADSAYSGQPIAEIVSKAKMTNCIHEKGYRNRPLSKEQKESNRTKSKTRARVEHIFGFIENSMNGSYIRTIGIKRATAVIGLMNLTYNMFRYIQLSQV